jgi:hypothetical protein
LLGTTRFFILLQHAPLVGIPFFDMTEDEWRAEIGAV